MNKLQQWDKQEQLLLEIEGTLEALAQKIDAIEADDHEKSYDERRFDGLLTEGHSMTLVHEALGNAFKASKRVREHTAFVSRMFRETVKEAK